MLPILLSIPHGGTLTPPELEERVVITPQALHDDSDAYTREIFALEDQVMAVVVVDIARAFVDLNRAVNDRPPANPDGVIKSMTCLHQPIYCPGQEPDPTLTEQLLARYYEPYHAQLQAALQNTQLRFAFDCHSMLPTGPDIGPDKGQTRPRICLGNRFGETSSMAALSTLAECFREVFQLEPPQVALNQPFAGGYVTRRYGGKPIPWMQIELNRSLYLSPPWFDVSTLSIKPARLQALNALFLETLRCFMAKQVRTL